MDKQVKKMWLKALRSGEYKQAHEVLQSNDGGFCCLGVLCDLHAKATGNTWTPRLTLKEYLDYSGELPTEVMHWAGLSQQTPYVFDKEDNLANLNDDGADFDLIAAIIEHEL